MTLTPTVPSSGGVQLKLGEALKRAQAHFAKNEFDDAERFASAIVTKHPRHVQALAVLAAVADRRGQTERAIALLQQSLTGAKTDALPLANLCRALRHAGRDRKSVV